MGRATGARAAGVFSGPGEAPVAAPPPGSDTAGSRLRPAPLALALVAVLVLVLLLAVSWGSTSVPPGDVWSVVLRRLGGQPARPGTDDLIIWQLRVPRALLAALVGAGLGVIGTTVQALVRNPLADPYLLGISSGASLGAVATVLLGATAGGLAGVGMSTAALLGAALSLALVWAVARRGGGPSGFSPLRLVLAGVAIGQLLSGFTSFLVLRTDNADQTHAVLFWLMGSLGGATWDTLPLPAAAVAAGLLCLQARARALNALVLGDETAASLGVPVTRLRRELFTVTSVLTGVLVAVSGAIAFIGLMVPHVCRLLIGGDHRRLLPLSALTGAVLLVVVDLVCRTALDTGELPIGVVTAVLGAPLLLYLIDRRLERDG